MDLKGTVPRDFRLQVFLRIRWWQNVPLVKLIPVVLLLREFSKKFEMTLMLFSGAWGKMIHEKNLK
jgi:hypothetical protein